MRTIHELLGRSPFGRLVTHTQRVHAVVALIRPLFEALLAEDWERTDEIHQEISRLEHKADKTKDKIRNHLPRSIFLPVDRQDLLKYLKQQDSIADAAEDVAVLVTLRRTSCPQALHAPLLALVDQVIRTSEMLLETGTELTQLVESTFGGQGAESVLERVKKVNDEEWEADKLERAVSRQLFELEDEMDPVSVVFWMRILAQLGRVADHAENTADWLRVMMVA